MPKTTKPKTIKALLLRTSNGHFDCLNVEVVDAPADTAAFVDFVQKHVGGYFEAHGAQLKRKHLTIYVNEEAAINGTDIGFILGKSRPLLGNAVIVESKRGKDVDFSLTPMDIGKNTLLVRLTRSNDTNN
jgi:hypothetical protein